MKLEVRTTAPTVDTKYYKTNNPYYPTYSMFKHKGNCADYCYFRFKESNKLSKIDLYAGNAENWLYYNGGYAKGAEPKIGAIGVYSKGIIRNGKDGAGHVFFVEKINRKNGKIVSIDITESGWNTFLFKYRTIKPPYNKLGYTFLGFLYSPNEFEDLHTYDGNYPTLPFRGYFKKGDTGANVKLLQKLLNWLNDTNLVVDGILGVKTQAEVKKFQKNHALVVDGLFGKKSLAKAKEVVK